MTTISPKRRRNAARGQFLLLLTLLALVVGAVFLLRVPLSSTVWLVGEPLVKTNNAWSDYIRLFFSGFSANAMLAQENERLRTLLASNAVLQLDRDILVVENRELKGRLGRIPPDIHSLVAVVLSRPPVSPYDTLVLDVGKSDAVSVGDLVSAGGSVYIGRVSEVYASTARVVLFSAPGESYSATLLHASSSTLAFSIKGQGGGSLVAEVPSGTLVRVGDKVIFNTLETELVGIVSHVAERTNSSFTAIYLQLPVNLSSLRFVEVRRSSTPS